MVQRKSKPRRVNSYTGVQGPTMDKGHGKLSRRHSTHNTNGEDKNDDKKAKTKIPVSRFRQTVEKVKAERRASNDNKEQESHIPIRRSSIPKSTRKAPTKPARKSIAAIKTEVQVPIAAEDEFDKLYEEVVHSPTPINIDVSLLDPKVDDPVKVESKFEEIIHDYDENRVQPIDVEKIKKSKIPFLKRRSQHEIDVPGRSGKIIAARDKLRMRHSLDLNDVRDTVNNESKPNVHSNVNTDEKVSAKTFVDGKSESIDQTNVKLIFESVNDENDVKVQEKIIINATVVNNENNSSTSTETTKTVTMTSSKVNEENESTKVVGTTIVTETVISESSIKQENIKGQMTEEIIQKDFIKIGIPVFDSYVHEHTENIETEKTVEVKNVLSYSPKQEDIQLDNFEANIEITEINTEPIITKVINDSEQSIVEMVDKSESPSKSEVLREIQEIEDTKVVIEDKNGSIEDIAKLRGKVGRLISKIGSHEPTETPKIDLGSELPKKKSVMSKIAMFERHEPEPIIKSKITKKDTKLPKLLTTNKQTSEKIHVHTPLIVDEVFKPFEAKTDPNITVNKIEITNGDKDSTKIVRAEMVIIESPEKVLYNIEDKTQIESNALFIEQSIISEEVLTPLLRKELKIGKEVTNKNDKKSIFEENKSVSVEAPVIVPKFIPVKEVLKRYESISDTHTKAVQDPPKIRSISEIRTPDANHRSLDDLFAHQVKPASDILNELKSDNKDEKNATKLDVNRPFKDDEGNNNEVFLSNDKRHGLKTLKSREFRYKTQESNDDNFRSLQYIQDYHNNKNDDMKRAKSLAELDLGDAVKGKVNKLIVRMTSHDKLLDVENKVAISLKEMPRKRSVSEKIALFERKLTPAKVASPPRLKQGTTEQTPAEELTADIQARIAELSAGKLKYGKMADMPRTVLANGAEMPVIALGTAMLDPRLAFNIVTAAIDLGYRAIDTAYIYGNEKVVGEAISAKIKDGTVTREELFIISKLWSTYHRTDLVKAACEASLAALGLEYFDLYLIHNPMSFKEGGAPLPKIATVLQYSEYEYIDAWFGMEALGSRARAIGVSNFNSGQIKRVLDRARVKPVVNQVECHPYLSQQRLDDFCAERRIVLSCFGVLGSKGTPIEYKSGNPAAIDDALVQVMASGLNVSPAQLLIRYQLECGHQVVVKSSSAAHLWDNLQALNFNLTSGQLDALHALNRNKRTFTFRGMGDTHKNYPFNTAF